MKMFAFPVGHPDVITEERITREAPPLPWSLPEHNPYRGILLVRVLPPNRGLRRALLPYRTKDGRLTFPLCAACAERNEQCERCIHQQWLKRSWVGAYTHVELNRALAMGYRVTDVYEVWNYTRWAGSNADGCTDPPLFADYINLFLKLKMESSGWPDWCTTAETKQDFIRQCRDRDGIDLDPSVLDLGPNPALRQIAVLSYCYL